MSEPLWRIYYADGGTFDSTQGCPSNAPAWGVQAIVQACTDEGKHVLAQFDYYWFTAGRWYAGDFAGLIDFLARSIVAVVRFGRVLAPREFERIRARADADPDFEPGGVWRSDRHSVPQPGVK